MKIVKKEGNNTQFVKGLTAKEFACKCNYEFCKATMIHEKLIEAFGKFRTLVNVPLIVNSGFRCAAHNADVGGKPLSRHTTGEAIDISLKTLDHLSNDDIEHAAKSCGFNFILFYDTFFHADVR